MSVHILGPQERLAQLLKREVELMLLHGSVHQDLSWYSGPLQLEEECEYLEGLERRIDELLGNNKLAERLGYQYTVDTDAAYFSNLEDMLGGEE